MKTIRIMIRKDMKDKTNHNDWNNKMKTLIKNKNKGY